MCELTFEEMDQVAGGMNPFLEGALGWALGKALDYLWNNSGNYIDYLVYCWGTYGAGPYDYSHVS